MRAVCGLACIDLPGDQAMNSYNSTLQLPTYFVVKLTDPY